MASQIMNKVNKSDVTHHQSTTLIVYCRLLSELDADLMVHHGSAWTRTDLIFHNRVSNVLCKFTYSMHICLISLVLGRIGQLQNAAQFLLDSIKGPVTKLKLAGVRDLSTNPLQ